MSEKPLHIRLQAMDAVEQSIYEFRAARLLHLLVEDIAPFNETAHTLLIGECGGLAYIYDLLSSKAANQSPNLLFHDIHHCIIRERKQQSAEQWQAARHRTVVFIVLAVIISRLSEPCRMLLARLSVLQGPFPLAAIEQGLGAVRAVWQLLQDWSLLRYDPLEQTYHIHTLTRRYAETLLSEPDRSQTQAQLAMWYKRYADQKSHNVVDYLEAHRLWRLAGNMQQAGELAIALAPVLRRFGSYSLLRELCITTLDDVRERDELLAAQAQRELGTIAYVQGDYEEARQRYGQSLGIFERLGDQEGRASTMHALGNIAHMQGNHEAAQWLYRQSLRIFEHLDD